MQKSDDELLKALDTYGPLTVGSEAWATPRDALRAARDYKFTPNIVVRGNTHLLGTFIPADRVSHLMALV